MSLTLVATAGAANANTYCTLAAAESYFESRLHNTTWGAATDVDKNAALAWATRLLDAAYEWAGDKYSSTQSLRWPRYGVVDADGYDIDYDSIPTRLEYATAEYAAYLIDADRTADNATAGFKKLKIDILELEVDRIDRAGTVPDSVEILIADFILSRKSGGSMVGLVRS